MNEITKELLEVLKSIMTLPDHKVDRRDEAKAARAATRERLFVLTWTDRYGERRGAAEALSPPRYSRGQGYAAPHNLRRAGRRG